MNKTIKCLFSLCAIFVFTWLFMICASADVTYNLSGNTLTISGSGAMTNYASKDNAPWYSDRASIKNIVINSGIKSIGSYSFYGCSNVTSISLPDSLTEIGAYAFSLNSKVETLIIPEKVTKIGNAAFYGCTNLKYLYFNAKRCETAGSESYPAFSGCTSLITVVPGNDVQIIPDYCFALTGIKSFNMTDNVRTIGEGAFYSCSSLTSVNMNYKINKIGERAFRGCSALSNFTLPELVTSIGAEAFQGCTSLKNITLSYHVTEIGADAFKDSGITINTTKDAYAYNYCNLYNYSCNATSTSYGDISGDSDVQLSVNTTSALNTINGKLVISVKFDTELLNECVHVAFYNSSNKVVDYMIIPITEKRNDIYIVTNDVNSASYAKVFVWDSLETLRPVSPFEKVTINRP